MAALKTHLIKALDNRRAAIAEHRKQVMRQAEQDSTAAGLIANLAAANRDAAASRAPSHERRQT